VTQQIKSVSEDIKERLLTRIKCSPSFALQIDESIDVAGSPQLLALKNPFMKISCSVDSSHTGLQEVAMFKAVKIFLGRIMSPSVRMEKQL
jgi:hypothetical protein